MKLKILQNWFFTGVLAVSAVGMAGGTTLKYSGGSVKYASVGLRSVLKVVHTVGENALGVTQAVGEGVKNVGKSLEEEFQSLNKFSINCLRDEEYQNLNTNYEFNSMTVEDDWTLIN